MRNKIAFRIENEDGEIELFVKLNIASFCGEGHAFFSRKDLNEFIEGLSRFPIDVMNPPVLTGGYWGQSGRVEQENVGISFIPKGNRGQIELIIRLAVPSDENQMKAKYSCSTTIDTTYSDVSSFVDSFRALINSELPGDYFEYPAHDI